MRSLFTYLIIIISLSSCASFSGKIIKKDKVKLTETDLKKITGTYELLPDIKYDAKGESEFIDKKASLNNIYSFLSDTKIEFDSLKKYTVRLDLINKNKLKFMVSNEKIIVDSIVMTGKLKNNGLFHLDNKFLKCHGIPYLFGGCINHKTRIGITKDNGLVVNQAVDNSGAFLLFIWSGYSYNSAYHFKKIE